jgi:transposase
MEQYVGLDVSQEQTSVCVVDGGGQVIWEGKCTSSPEAIAATIQGSAATGFHWH